MSRAKNKRSRGRPAQPAGQPVAPVARRPLPPMQRIADMYPEVTDWRPARRAMVAELMELPLEELKAYAATSNISLPTNKRGHAFKYDLAKLIALDEFPVRSNSHKPGADGTRIRAF